MKPNQKSENNPGYLLLLRGTDWHKSLSLDEVKATMDAWGKWFEELCEKDLFLNGSPLESQGHLISTKSGQLTDGPFAESKEMIGGYIHLKVDNLEEAIEIGRQCPALVHGLQVEVRPVRTTCPVQQMLDDMRDAALV